MTLLRHPIILEVLVLQFQLILIPLFIIILNSLLKLKNKNVFSVINFIIYLLTIFFSINNVYC